MDDAARQALDSLPDVPGGRQLLSVADRFEGLWLVGGAVRDALLGAAPRDLDLAVEGDVDPVARALGWVAEAHERFGTAEVHIAGGGTANVARTRAESYAEPGALPDVRPAEVGDDLRRRDFTINAMAVGLSPDVRGEVRAAEHAVEDVRAGVLRVLHDASFIDDPTRLLRMARYQSRLGLAVDEHTAALAAAAVADGALRRTVSGDRVGQELRLLLAEADPLAALAAARAALDGVVPEPEPDLARAALALLPDEGRRDLVILASGAVGAALRTLGAEGEQARAASERWHAPPVRDAALRLGRALAQLRFTAPESRRAADAARAPRLAAAFAAARRPSEIADAASEWPVEAVALAGALGPEEAARTWLEDLRHVRLGITGRDLIAAGVNEGPDIGRRLRRALAARLNGELAPGPQAELAAALEG